jgi:hypothetical protein
MRRRSRKMMRKKKRKKDIDPEVESRKFEEKVQHF